MKTETAQLLSAIVYLDSLPPEANLTASGPQMQGWFFKTLSVANPALAEDVHEKGGYSVSGILSDKNGCYIRLTSLRADLSELLLGTILPSLKENQLILDLGTFSAKMTFTQGHVLAGQTSFAALRKGTSSANSLRVRFASPTAFRGNGMDLPLPTPYHLLLSWWRTWNKFAPETERFGYPIHLFAEDCIAVARLLDIKTEETALPKNNAAVGFTGTVAYTLQPFAKCEDWAYLWKDARRDWQTLAQFAQYSGTGQHTGSGMGQTHRVAPS